MKEQDDEQEEEREEQLYSSPKILLPSNAAPLSSLPSPVSTRLPSPTESLSARPQEEQEEFIQEILHVVILVWLLYVLFLLFCIVRL